jgi:hypothetical protein
MKKIISKIVLMAMLVLPLSLALPASATAPVWDTTGHYVVGLTYQGTAYTHDMSLVQDSSGNLTGNGGSPSGANVYTWTITSGSVIGDSINFVADYTATADAVSPLTVFNVTGMIGNDGSMSGNWSDNYQGGARNGTWSTTSGNAVALNSLAAQDFGVMNISGVAGYTSGFGLTGATLAQVKSIVVQLYSGTNLLQTDTATPQISTLTGTDFSSPFDVFGTFNYVTDGYWTNVRASEYGQTLIPTNVVATVTLNNGKVLTATNTALTGDPTTIFPIAANIITDSATAVTSSDATLNGTNGATAATGHSFWVSLDTFSTASPTLPANVYSTADLGAIAVNTASSASLSSVDGLPAVTPNTTYYFAAWSNVGGTWYPGTIMNFTTAAATTPPTSVQVHLYNYVDGVQATSISANGGSFPMLTTYNDTNVGSATNAPFTLNPTGWTAGDIAYEASTGARTPGSSASFSEDTSGALVGTACSLGDPYALVGYTSGSTLALAQAATPTTTPPSFTNMVNDEYVIVWNNDCAQLTGPIGGTVTGGASGTGVLAVTSITPVQTTATADDTYGNGWSYKFNITVPTNEPNLSMDFADWFNSTSSNTLLTAGDMQISSPQADNNGAVIPITAANVYSAPLHMTGDLVPGTDGLQVQVLVQVKIPTTTVNDSYITNYGVQTTP